MASENSGGLKGIGVILMIISLITGIAAIVTPMNNRINAIEKNSAKIETRVISQIDKLDEKLQIRIDDIKEDSERNFDMITKHNERHEGNNARMDEKIKFLIKYYEKLENEHEKVQEEILEYYKKKGEQ